MSGQHRKALVLPLVPRVRPRSPATRCVLLVACLAALGGLIFSGILLNTRPSMNPLNLQRLPLVIPAWVAFGAAIWLLRGVRGKLAAGVIVGGAIALQVVAISAPPSGSSDLYRYMWDGRVQAAGIDPYLYPPSAAAVARLRNDFIWAPYTATPPPVSSSPDVFHYCPASGKSKAGRAFDPVAGCSKINHTNAPTIYPPVAEAYFTVVDLAAPADDATTPIQAAGAACAVLTTLVLLFGLRRMGRDPRLAALWGWCPLVVLEGGNNAHVDVLAALLASVAVVALTRVRTEGRAMLGGALVGLAMAAKMTPAFLLPAVMRRGWQHILLAAATAFGVGYAPHVMAVGGKVIGFLPGYLKEQGYNSGNGFDIIGLLVPGKAATGVAIAALGLVALAVIRYCDPDQPWRGGLYMTAAALTITTPQFQWYALFLVLLVAFDGRWEWLALAFGGYVANDSHLTASVYLSHPRLLGYGGGLVLAGSITLARILLSRRAAYRPGAVRPGTVPAVMAGMTGPYHLITPAAMGERDALARPSMEACETTMPSMPSAQVIAAPGELAGTTPRGSTRATATSSTPAGQETAPASSLPRRTPSRRSAAGSTT